MVWRAAERKGLWGVEVFLEVGRKGHCFADSPVIEGSGHWQSDGVFPGWRSKDLSLGGTGKVVGLQTAGCTGPVS